MEVLNRNYDQAFSADFVEDAVGESIDETAAHTRRELGPGFRIVLYALQCLFNFLGEFEP